MESIKIEKDGSMTIPTPGNMKITVEMTEGLFEEFIQFRKSKDEYENRASKEIACLRGRITHLAQAVIESAEGKTPKAKKRLKSTPSSLLTIGFVRSLLWDIGKYRRQNRFITLLNIRQRRLQRASDSALNFGSQRKRIVKAAASSANFTRSALVRTSLPRLNTKVIR